MNVSDKNIFLLVDWVYPSTLSISQFLTQFDLSEDCDTRHKTEQQGSHKNLIYDRVFVLLMRELISFLMRILLSCITLHHVRFIENRKCFFLFYFSFSLNLKSIFPLDQTIRRFSLEIKSYNSRSKKQSDYRVKG